MAAYVDEKADARIEMFEEKSGPLSQQPLAQAKPSTAAVVSSVGFYIAAATLMIFANKFVLNAVSIPVTFLWCQLVIAVVLLQISAMLGYFTLPKLELQTARELAPLIAVNCTGLLFNTYCLQYVDASFYQVARGLVLPFTVLFSFIFLHQTTSKQTFLSTVVVCVGFFAGVSGEKLRVSRIGIILGVFSSITTSVHAIVIKRTCANSNTLDLVYYNNALSAIVISPLIILSGEWRQVLEMVAEGGAASSTFVLGTAITGVFGFLLCVAGFISIKVTSPVSHMISAAVRGVLQTFLGIWLFKDKISSGRASGIALILIGSLAYTYSKATEAQAPAVLLPISTSSTPSASPIISRPQSRKPSLGGDLGTLPTARKASAISELDSEKAKFS